MMQLSFQGLWELRRTVRRSGAWLLGSNIDAFSANGALPQRRNLGKHAWCEGDVELVVLGHNAGV